MGATPEVPFIIETGHESFNPSIFRHGREMLIAWRQGWSPSVIWIGALNESYELTSQGQLDLSPWFSHGWSLEDPHLFAFQDQLHLSFTVAKGGKSAVAVVKLNAARKPQEVQQFRSLQFRSEKNWQFFEHRGALHAVYLVNPHMTGLAGGGKLVFQDKSPLLRWEWGEARGGTPPVRIGNEYFSFFHSSTEGNYVGGFYSFEASPPFRITRWPAKPCLTAVRDVWRNWGNNVVFPCGAVHHNGLWTVSYGWQDTHCCLAQWRHEDLLNTLLPAEDCRVPAHLRHGSRHCIGEALTRKGNG